MNIKKLLGAGVKYIFNSNYRFNINASFIRYDRMPDERFLKKKYKSVFRRCLNLENPVTFNEKLQWLKLYDRKPEYTMMVDKYAVREYVAKMIGEEYLIPLLGVWEDPEEIDFDSLPDQFVLKCNHNSGTGMCICKDKSKLDVKKVKSSLRLGLEENYYIKGREWPYKNVKRRITAEQYLQDESGELQDYKVHCFNGEPRFVLVCRDRFTKSGVTEDFYTTDWEHMPMKRPGIPNAKQEIPRPEQLETMLTLARKLAKDLPFSRIDFYIVQSKICFGEITFFPASGFNSFEPDRWDETLGSWITLPEKTLN